MSRLKRIHFHDQPVFVTSVTHRRFPLFKDNTHISQLRQIMAELREEIPFKNIAWVILPDHFHWVFVPEDENKRVAMSEIIHRVKRRFSLRCGIKGSVWQKRFFDHVIRDEKDLLRHLDYIHFNPVKHGYVYDASSWQASSLLYYKEQGLYPSDWGQIEPSEITDLDYE